MTAQTYQIVNGPSQEALFDSLRLSREGRIVEFVWVERHDKGGGENRIAVEVLGIMAGTGSMWNVWGLIMSPILTSRDRSVLLNYDSKRRGGIVQFSVGDTLSRLTTQYR